MILLTLSAAIDSAGTTTTFYLSDSAFVTSPSDTPSNTAFDPRLISQGSIGIHAYADGRTGGQTRLEQGEIVVANADGALDEWISYSFDGRPIAVYSGSGGAFPGSFSTVFVGTIESVEATFKQIVIRLRDKQWKLRLPALTTTYGGTNSLPSGIDGTSSDIKGKVKPKVYGKVSNISPPCVNTSKLVYQVSTTAIQSFDAVYDNAVALTPGTDYANSTLLLAAATPASTVDTCKAEGLFRLGTSPVGEVTADVTQGANAAARTTAQILKQLALDAGIVSGDISSADVAALDTANSAVVGIWLNDSSSTFSQAMDEISASVGAYYGFDSTGVLRMGRLTAPSGTAVATLYDFDIKDDIERRPARDNAIPIWKAKVNHSKIYTTQSSGIATSVTAARRAYLAEDYRSSVSTDATIKTQWLLAGDLEVSGLLTSSSDADTEAARLLALFKVLRSIYDVTVQLDVVTDNQIEIMDVVDVVLSRFGMDSGKSFRVLGMVYDLENSQVTISLWG